MWNQVGFKTHYYNKASGGDRIPTELFKTLKDDAVQVPHSISRQIWKTQQWPQFWKRSIFIPIPNKDNTKEYSDQWTIALISHARKVMLKPLQAKHQQYKNRVSPDVQAGFKKGRGTTDQIAKVHWSWRKQRNSGKISTSVSCAARVKLLQSCPTLCDLMDGNLSDSSVHEILQVPILECVTISFSNFCFTDLDCGDHSKLWKILKRDGNRDHLTCLLRIYM